MECVTQCFQALVTQVFSKKLEISALHSILPVIVLAFSSFASFSRYVRNSMVEVINMDYVRTARSKGLKKRLLFTNMHLKMLKFL